MFHAGFHAERPTQRRVFPMGLVTERRFLMKRMLLAGATAAAIMLSGQAIAEGTVVEIAPEQRTKIKEYVVKEKIAPVRVKERISVGTRLPADVELRAVPSAWGPSFSKYRYVYSDDHVYFVDLANRTVVQAID